MENEKMIIPETAPYKISTEMYGEAYRIYQKIFVYPKNYIFQALLLILAVDFGYHAGKDPSNMMAYLLCVVCIAFIFVLWYNPKKMRRSVMDVVREIEGDEYTFTFTENKMFFKTLPPEHAQDKSGKVVSPAAPTELCCTRELRVVERSDFFLICKGKQLFYVLPKYALNDNQAVIFRETLENNLGKRFRCKI